MKEMQLEYLNLSDIIPYENNPRHNDEAVEYVANSIKEFGFKVPIIIDENNVIVAGHTRLKACERLGIKKAPCIRADDLTEDQIKAFRLADNKVGEIATWDLDKLNVELENIDFDMTPFGFDNIELDTGDFFNKYQDGEKNSLQERFVVPPFSVLDGRQGYWKEKKRAWKEKIVENAVSREKASKTFEKLVKMKNLPSVSFLDPVLCEVVLKWFMPKNGEKVFDCFAGSTTFGYVAGTLGYKFTGIELRKAQVEYNMSRQKADNLPGQYICDDGRNVCNHIPPKSQDMFFSCPPYYDIEVYSDLENDASNQKTYKEFYDILDVAFSESIKCLKENCFAVVVAGDIRDKKTGAYYDFCSDIKNTFKKNGLFLYNELILVDPIGSAAMRANRMMVTRKMVKVHQNVLVFLKGDPKHIQENFDPIEFSEEDLQDAGEEPYEVF